jgi:ACR3 family arsenite efflux pump ArsB
MWPILTKVQYEKLPAMFQTVSLWRQIILSLILNWILGPFVGPPISLDIPLIKEDHACGSLGDVT